MIIIIIVIIIIKHSDLICPSFPTRTSCMALQDPVNLADSTTRSQSCGSRVVRGRSNRTFPSPCNSTVSWVNVGMQINKASRRDSRPLPPLLLSPPPRSYSIIRRRTSSTPHEAPPQQAGTPPRSVRVHTNNWPFTRRIRRLQRFEAARLNAVDARPVDFS